MQLGTAFRIDRLYNPFDNASTYLNVGYYNSELLSLKDAHVQNVVEELRKDEFFQLNEMGVSGILETRRLQKLYGHVNNQFL